ncbi:unknown [Candidatus Apopatosoma intestinale]|nr:unknown [Candidatus Apopatosoma intestinale]
MVKLFHIELAVLDKICEYIVFCNCGFSNFFFENLYRDLALFGFKLLKTLLGGCGQNSRLNGVDEIVNAFFYFIKLLAKNRKRAALGIELCDQHICKSVE